MIKDISRREKRASGALHRLLVLVDRNLCRLLASSDHTPGRSARAQAVLDYEKDKKLCK